MIRKHSLLLGATVVSLVSCAVARIQIRPSRTQSIEQQFAQLKALRRTWMLESWKGSDAPFVATQRQIDRAIAGGQTPRVLAQTYKRLAQAAPRDAQAQFRWAYAAWKGSDAVSRGIDRPLLEGVAHAMWQPPSPRSYRYARLLFLVSNTPVTAVETLPLGERLLRRNPKDYEVMYAFIPLLYNRNNGDVERGIRYAKQLVKNSPNRLKYNLMLSYTYTANPSNTREHKRLAIAVCEKCLRLSPPPEVRRRTETLLGMLRRELQTGG